MTIRSAFGDGDGIIYVVNAAGDLLWYRHMRHSGDAAWDGRSGAMIGNGWGDFVHLVTGGSGVIYAVKPTGELLWYKRTARDASPQNWEPSGGIQIGEGWASFKRVFSGGGGVLYGINAEGKLFWAEHLAFDGRPLWASDLALQVGEGWGGFLNVFSGGQGVIYAVTNTGDLLWYRHMSRFGDPIFASEGKLISTPTVRWNAFSYVFSDGNGVIYGITASGELMWHEHLSRSGQPEWANDGASRSIGVGWNLRAPLEGYCTPLSVAPGQRIDFHLSSDQANVSLEYFRLKRQADGGFGLPVASATITEVPTKPISENAYQTGCNWSSDVSLNVPTDWRSGLYTARFKSDGGKAFDVVFIVKPGLARGDFAVLANTHTWTAYNDWCDRSQYTNPNAALLSMERPNPSTSPLDNGQLNHLTRAELWVLNWLEDSGYRFDLYSDVDFHEGVDGLQSYKALILHTHPEYWTTAMRDHLDSFLGGGGRLLYLAGNGLYEEVQYAESQLILRGG
jgi:N,N-dimethylformamidase